MSVAESGGGQSAWRRSGQGESDRVVVGDTTGRSDNLTDRTRDPLIRPDASRLTALPPRVRRQRHRPAQSRIPDSRTERDRLRETAARYVAQQNIVPPISMDELRDHATSVLTEAGIGSTYQDYATIVVSNEIWRDTLSRIPHDRRLLLLPQCLRHREHCSATIDEFGLVCNRCGSCPIHELTAEAEDLGYAVLVAEGSAVVLEMLETGRIEAVIGVSCMSVLEKCFPHMEARAVPGMAIPLLQDGCADTTVDLDWVWDAVYLTSDDRTCRLNLNTVKHDVRSWFTKESLETILGQPRDETEKIAQDWLARAGKRWRPYLTVCVYLALRNEMNDEPPLVPQDLKKLAVAVECFHKASLIHDDIEDDDDKRYGESTIHVECGVPIALNVGDFLLGEGYRLIAEIDADPQIKVDMLRTAADGHLTLSRGQGAELCWCRCPRTLTTLEVLDIFRQKTAPAFEVALRLGAFYGGADNEIHEVLRRYSESLGIAYQVRDDLEDYSGESDTHDLRDLRPSVILAIAHKRATVGTETELVSSLWNHTRTYDEVAEELQSIIRKRGVIDTAQDLLESYTQQATRSLRPLRNPTLKGLLRRVIGTIFGDSVIEGYCRGFEARNDAGGRDGAEPAP